MEPGCRNDPLGCIICKRMQHSKHNTMPLKQFMEGLEEKLKPVHPGRPEGQTLEEQCLNHFSQF